ncbi:31-O-demethyl-FK506 methyltransferase FkbM [Methylophilaceae bacterium]|nr:31-O-demethyl-FK506 methyltransferase FkbM [Methylophilaceae bacterium]
MFLDNLLPSNLGALAAPACFLKRLRYPSMVSFGLLANLSRMRSRNIIDGVDSIWDIGANRGQFAFMANSIWPELPVYSFEPDPESYKVLRQNVSRFSIPGNTFCYALSDKVEATKLKRYAEHVNNSLLQRDVLNEHPLEEVVVECTTLDVVSSQVPEFNAAFLKLDVQGFELAVLAGARDFLDKCLFVLVEVSFAPAYANGAHAGEIILAMRDYGFECIEILDLLRDKHGKNRILEADILFQRTALAP